MTPFEIIERVRQHKAEAVTSAIAEGLYPHVVLQAGYLKAIAEFLKNDPRLRFDLLRCITATDRPAAGQVELTYDLKASAPYGRPPNGTRGRLTI
jgi:hypothetical protein